MPSLAKVSRPRLARDFPRTRLFRRLDGALERRAVWVGGPPGAGKTTLVASYVQSRRLPCLWYQVDEGDADVASFFYHLGLAARKAAPRSRRPVRLLTPEHHAGLAVFARRFFEDLCRRLAAPLVLVLDNLHEVPADAPLHLALREGLDALPDSASAILIGRGDPPPAFARLQANGALGVLGPEELRLDAGEVEGIARLWGLDHLDRQTVRALHERTQGWVAGLVLMLARRSAAEVVRPPTGSTPAVVFDYFAGEIFARSDRTTQEVLLKTALLPRATASMAEELTGTAQAGLILADLDRKGYFVLRREQPEPAYEYHPLFREFLLARGKDFLGPELLAATQRAAAALLCRRGQVEDAVQVLCNAGAWDAMAEAVLERAPAMLETGRADTLGRWIDELPEVVRRARPWLLYWLGMARLPFEPARARACFESAFDAFLAGAGDPAGAYLSWAGVVDTYLYGWSDFAPLDRWIATFERLRSRFPDFASHEVEARAAFGMFVALMYRQPHHPELPAWQERVWALTLGSCDAHLRMAWGHHLLLYAILCAGDLGKARVVFDSLRPIAESGQIAPLVSVVWQAMVARYHWMSAAPKACLEAVEGGLELSRASGVHLWDFMLLAQGVWGSLVAGDLGRAGDFLRRMGSAHGNDRRLNAMMFHGAEAILALRSGEPRVAVEQSRIGLELAEQAGSPFGLAICRLTLAMAHMAQGEDAEAAAHLGEARRIGAGMEYIEYLCLLPGAELALRRGDESAAAAGLREAMAAGRERGILAHVMLRPEDLARLCSEALARGIETEFVRDLVRRNEVPPPERALELESWPWAVAVRTLGHFAAEKDGAALGLVTRAHRKPLELLQALVALGCDEVSEGALADALWPDAEGDAAHHALETNLYRLRKLLGHERAVTLVDGRLSLDGRYTWVDSRAFERLVARATRVLEAQRPPARARIVEVGDLTERILGLYRGPFLAEAGEQPWLVATRVRLRDKFLRYLSAAGRYFEQVGELGRATDCRRRRNEADQAGRAVWQGAAPV